MGVAGIPVNHDGRMFRSAGWTGPPGTRRADSIRAPPPSSTSARAARGSLEGSERRGVNAGERLRVTGMIRARLAPEVVMSALSRLAVLSLVLALPAPLRAETPAGGEPPAAEALADLVARARAHQQDTAAMLRRYSWVQHETTEITKPSGKVAERSERKVRVFPIEGGVVVDLIEVDGRAPTAKELAANEKRNERASQDAARRAAEAQPDEPDEDAAGSLLELLSRTRFEVAGRQVENGRELIGIAFEPDPKARGEGPEKKLLRHVRGTVWLDAETAQPVRCEAGAADRFRMKAVVGVKSFALEAEQVRVADEIWLPSRFRFEGDFTLLGIKRHVRTDVAFSEYSRASVATESEISAVPAP